TLHAEAVISTAAMTTASRRPFITTSHVRRVLSPSLSADAGQAVDEPGSRSKRPDKRGHRHMRFSMSHWCGIDHPWPGRQTQAAADGQLAGITLLAVTTGLRACDIINLRLADIDWRARTASIVQQKTHNPLTVPLTDLLAARLADYVLDQRPDSPDDY